ncbi:MAG TPA: hypothetical protein VK832_15210 [Burkholderiaceae bacterium]|jgi:hypothetical protein|nr:hypothetical protein [Burkholderiaceae bacterium]
MNFALLVSNLPDIHQVRYTLQASPATRIAAPSAIKQMALRLLRKLQGN